MLLEELQKLVAAGESENLEFKKTTGQRTEKKVLVTLLKQGRIVYTITEKPNSRLQKYKLTE
jgi:hypothetical protein